MTYCCSYSNGLSVLLLSRSYKGNVMHREMGFALLIIIFFISGCATHKSPHSSGNLFLYVTDDEESIFDAAYNAMLDGWW